jgi:hypothetical protein
MTHLDVVSANKALDYYDGDQLRHLEYLLDGGRSDGRGNTDSQGQTILNGGIKDWRARGVYPLFVNVTKKIIDRSALSYQRPPERKVMVGETLNESATDDYKAILRNARFESVMDVADSVARLLKEVILLAQPVEVENGEDKIMVNILHRGNCDVDFDFKNGTIRSLMFQSAGCGPHGGKLFHMWTTEESLDIELVGSKPVVVGRESHGFGIIPAAVLFDTSRPRCGFWHKPAWDEIVRLNEGTNLMHTEVKHAERFQAFPPLFTNAKMPADMVIGSDAVVEIQDPGGGAAIFLEYRSSDINLDEFMNWLKDLTADVADDWGVNLRVSGGGSADSGFKLVVEEIWNLETRNDRLKAATQFERDFYQVILAISNDQNLGLPADSELLVKFPAPRLPVNEKEAHDIRKEELALELISREQIWRDKDPDITDAEIEARKALIIADRQGDVPGFGNIVSEA